MAKSYYIAIINGKKSYKKVMAKYQAEVKEFLENAVEENVITQNELVRYLDGEIFKCSSLM